MLHKKFKSLRLMLLVFLTTTLLMNYVLINAYIPSGSMENTIMTGDRIIGLRLIRQYHRGDIVIFPDPDGGGYYLIKRIIGLPGYNVTIKNGTLSINGTPLEEPYLKEVMRKDETFSITVPEEGYFMMGDNRNDSFDARYWENKIVYEENITGKAILRYWPVPSFGAIS